MWWNFSFSFSRSPPKRPVYTQILLRTFLETSFLGSLQIYVHVPSRLSQHFPSSFVFVFPPPKPGPPSWHFTIASRSQLSLAAIAKLSSCVTRPHLPSHPTPFPTTGTHKSRHLITHSPSVHSTAPPFPYSFIVHPTSSPSTPQPVHPLTISAFSLQSRNSSHSTFICVTAPTSTLQPHHSLHI